MRRHVHPNLLSILLLAASGIGGGPGAGAAPKPADVRGLPAGTPRVEQPWSRPTAPGVGVGVGYMVIVNPGKADALIAASSPVAERVELHLTQFEGGMMRMRQVGRVELPAGATVRLEPGGLHMMLIGLKQPLAEGAAVPLVLRFEKAGEVRVELKVDPDGPT